MAYTFNPFTGTFDNAPSTLKGDSAYSTLCAISGDLVNYEYLHEGFLPLSGGTLTGNVSSVSSIYIDGELRAGSREVSTLYVAEDKVGVNTETPNEELTVVGNISANGVIYADGGNSTLWNEVYTSYSTTSSTFLTSETDSQTLSFDEGTKDLSISNGNTVSLSALVDAAGIDTGVRELTANWESTYNTVSALSSEWSAADEVLVAQVTNADSVTLNRGDIVYTFGATGDVMSVKLASNLSEATSSRTLGVINETIIPNGIGYATVAGRMDKMSFPAPFVEGDALWLGSTPGTFTRVKPVAPQHGVYLGVVERANNGNGIAYIKVQNGYELEEIHNVLITNPTATQVLQLSSDGVNLLWVNNNIDKTHVTGYENWDSTYDTVNSLSGDWISLNTVTDYLSTNNVLVSSVTVLDQLSAIGNVYVDGNFVTNTITAGSSVGTSVLYVGSESKVGINTETPNEALTVVGNISATGIVYGDASGLQNIIDTEVRSLTSSWDSVYTNVNSNSATYVRTVETTTPGISAITTIVAVSALPGTQDPGTLYILV